MQTVKTKNNAVAVTQGAITAAEPMILRKRIGSIVYEVVIHFDPNANERMSDKKLRLIKREMEATS